MRDKNSASSGAKVITAFNESNAGQLISITKLSIEKQECAVIKIM